MTVSRRKFLGLLAGSAGAMAVPSSLLALGEPPVEAVNLLHQAIGKDAFAALDIGDLISTATGAHLIYELPYWHVHPEHIGAYGGIERSPNERLSSSVKLLDKYMDARRKRRK